MQEPANEGERILDVALDGAGSGGIVASLQAGEVGAHIVGSPGVVAGYVGDVIPVAVLGDHGDHGIVGGASAQGARAGIPDGIATIVLDLLLVARLLGIIGIVTDEVV